MGKRQLQNIKRNEELYGMVYSQSFLGQDFDVLYQVMDWYGIQYKLYYGYDLILSNTNVLANDDDVMLLTTDSLNSISNLHLCTALTDVIYLPACVRSAGLIRRVDEWLGLSTKSIEPCPAHLPPSDPRSFVNIMDELEEHYQVRYYIF